MIRPVSRSIRTPLVFTLFLLAAAAASSSLTPARADDGEVPAKAPYSETVVVSSTRIADQPEEANDVPASTTVITRQQIEASGARTVQQLLSHIAGAILFDQIGNGVQTTFDLRGFTGGGITVLVDGARINDPRNNSVQLETIGLDSVERIEIVRGAAAATVGGGSAAGVVNILTRAGSGAPRAIVEGSYGSFGTAGLGVQFSGSLDLGSPSGGGSGSAPSSGPGASSSGSSASSGSSPLGASSASAASSHSGTSTGAFDWMLAVSRDRTDGFRENGGGTLTRSALGLGYTFAAGSRLALNLRSTGDDFGAPGALTPQELAADSFDSPFNSLDNSDLTYRQATLLWNGHVGGPFSLAANLTYESRDSTALTTGRSAATFGGFILDDTVRGMNGVVQSTAQARTGALRHMFVFGAEGSRGTNDADGCGTSPSSLTTCDPSSFLNSSNSTTREDLAGFAQDTVDLGRGFGVLGGVRWDQSKYDYTETLPNPANDQSMSFSQTSWKAGVTWNPSLSAGLYASYGESFQPPTVEDLFAFPGFGSNPDLAPANAKNYEVGLRGGFGSAPRAAGAGPAALEYTVSFYRTNLTNEIIFVALPTPGNPFGGQNQNAAESRRQGAELTVNWRAQRWLDFLVEYSYTDATFENGVNAGNEIPLVPKNRFSGSAELTLPKGWSGRLSVLAVGDQVLSNDAANTEPRLASYTVVNARIDWRPGGSSAAPRPSAVRDFLGSLEFFVEGRNLLDEEYATRGISAFDFSTFSNQVYLTPAAPRSFVGGLSVAF